MSFVPVLAGLMVACAAARVQGDWPFERQYLPLKIHADFPLTRLDPLLQELVQLRRDLCGKLQLPTPNEPIDVYLFSQSDIYHRYMQRHFPDVHPRRAMFVKADSPGNVFAFVSPELATDLRHECTHAFLHATLPIVPLWLDEGLAEYFEVPSTNRAFDHAHMQATRRGILWSRPPSLTRLEALVDLSQMDGREYQESWAWVHFLLHGPPAAQQVLTSYLSDLQTQSSFEPMSRRMEKALPEVDREFVQHFQRWKR